MKTTEILELCEKATKGPWKFEPAGWPKETADMFEMAPLDDEGLMDWSREICATPDGEAQDAANIAFIAMALTELPRLAGVLAEVAQVANDSSMICLDQLGAIQAALRDAGIEL